MALENAIDPCRQAVADLQRLLREGKTEHTIQGRPRRPTIFTLSERLQSAIIPYAEAA